MPLAIASIEPSRSLFQTSTLETSSTGPQLIADTSTATDTSAAFPVWAIVLILLLLVSCLIFGALFFRQKSNNDKVLQSLRAFRSAENPQYIVNTSTNSGPSAQSAVEYSNPTYAVCGDDSIIYQDSDAYGTYQTVEETAIDSNVVEYVNSPTPTYVQSGSLVFSVPSEATTTPEVTPGQPYGYLDVVVDDDEQA